MKITIKLFATLRDFGPEIKEMNVSENSTIEKVVESLNLPEDIPLLKIVNISQEHGLITSDAPITFEKFPVGSFLQVIPNHSCLTAALFAKYHVIETNRIVDEWLPIRGW